MRVRRLLEALIDRRSAAAIPDRADKRRVKAEEELPKIRGDLWDEIQKPKNEE